MKTRQELIAATLGKLNVLAAGQDPEPEDVQKIDGIIDDLLDDLNTREILHLSNPSLFAGRFFNPLAILLADWAAPDFGQPSNADSREFAENRLREMRNTPRVDSDVTPSLYY